MRFDLTDLKLFCEVVDAGSITAGAEKSALALAAASTRIRNMELALGAPLLVRARHGVTPTQAGRTLLVLDTVTGSDAERLYTKSGWQRCGVIPDYALWPQGGLCSTTVFYRQL